MSEGKSYFPGGLGTGKTVPRLAAGGALADSSETHNRDNKSHDFFYNWSHQNLFLLIPHSPKSIPADPSPQRKNAFLNAEFKYASLCIHPPPAGLPILVTILRRSVHIHTAITFPAVIQEHLSSGHPRAQSLLGPT